MREIKFRAWDGEEMRTQLMVARPQMADCLSIMTNEIFAQNHYDLKEWKVMQFTGLLDKSGKEIYEGDIYRTEDEHEYGDERYYTICVWLKEITCFAWLTYGEYVNWEDNGFDALHDHGVPFNCCVRDCKRISICGNIHENPELLKLCKPSISN